MNFLKNAADKITHQGGNHNEGEFNPEAGGHQYQTGVVPPTKPQENNSGGGIMGSINNALGGGAKGEANEDYLDKAVDMFQQKVMGAGDQSNESATEQAKDEMISDQLRAGYKNITGHEFPIADKS